MLCDSGCYNDVFFFLEALRDGKLHFPFHLAQGVYVECRENVKKMSLVCKPPAIPKEIALPRTRSGLSYDIDHICIETNQNRLPSNTYYNILQNSLPFSLYYFPFIFTIT